ncbi:MAG: glycosyltransferase family 4 protein [Firmicutes bacterium]|nr:glycosyltransferase family 4 protein [Bacillota bacterium]
MNILMISEFFPPVLGGIAVHVASLANVLANRGHKIRVLALGWKGLNSYERKNNFEIFRISGLFQKTGFIYGNKNYRFHPPIHDPIVVKRVGEHIREFHPDIIHCHGWVVFSLLRIKKIFNVPLILTLHDYGLICPTRTVFKDSNTCSEVELNKCILCCRSKVGLIKAHAMCRALLFNKNKLDLVDKYIAVSNDVKEIHKQFLNIPDQKFEVVHNFFGSEVQVRELSNVALPDDFILFVGAMKPEKGIDVLIQAYRKLNTKVKLVIIGMKRAGYNFKKDENVVFLENQPHSVVLEAWRKCRFGVVPSIWADPCPTVALEAMACGKAVVASDIGGLKDIVVHDETGLLVSPGDVNALMEAMKILIENSGLAEEMGRRGYRRLKREFSEEKLISKIENIYQELIKITKC